MKYKYIKNKSTRALIALLVIVVGLVTAEIKTNLISDAITNIPKEEENVKQVKSLSEIPEYEESPYIILNDNVPEFKDEDLAKGEFEEYSELDSLGRVGVAYANINQKIMPTEKRGSIGMVKPTGWHTIRYDNVDGKYLYNRCHLIGFQLAGENANRKNLMTGTRYLNVDGMLPFENEVADYIKNEAPSNHVLYRVTPIYEKDNLIAKGVQMEAYSLEDSGEGIQFNVFVYNVQPGIVIDYHNGESRLIE